MEEQVARMLGWIMAGGGGDHVCMYVCMYVCLYIYIHTYIYALDTNFGILSERETSFTSSSKGMSMDLTSTSYCKS